MGKMGGGNSRLWRGLVPFSSPPRGWAWLVGPKRSSVPNDKICQRMRGDLYMKCKWKNTHVLTTNQLFIFPKLSIGKNKEWQAPADLVGFCCCTLPSSSVNAASTSVTTSIRWCCRHGASVVHITSCFYMCVYNDHMNDSESQCYLVSNE